MTPATLYRYHLTHPNDAFLFLSLSSQGYASPLRVLTVIDHRWERRDSLNLRITPAVIIIHLSAQSTMFNRRYSNYGGRIREIR